MKHRKSKVTAPAFDKMFYADMDLGAENMDARLLFPDDAVLAIIATVIDTVGIQPAIAGELYRRIELQSGTIEEERDRLMVTGEGARQIRRTIGGVAAGTLRPLFDPLPEETLRIVRKLDEQLLSLNEVPPNTIDAGFKELLELQPGFYARDLHKIGS